MEGVRSYHSQDPGLQPGLSPRRVDAESGLHMQSPIPKVDIQFGSMASTLRTAPSVVPLDNGTGTFDRKQKLIRTRTADEDLKGTTNDCGISENSHENDLNAKSEGWIQGQNMKCGTDATKEGHAIAKAKVRLVHSDGRKQKCVGVKTPTFKLDDSWKKSKDFYSIRYNMAFNQPSNQSLLSYDDAARTSRPKTVAFNYKEVASGSTDGDEKATKQGTPSRSLCTLSPVVSPRSHIEPCPARSRSSMKTQETKYKQSKPSDRQKDGLWIKTESVAVPDLNCLTESVLDTDQNDKLTISDYPVNAHYRKTESSRSVQDTQTSQFDNKTDILSNSSAIQGGHAAIDMISAKQSNSYLSCKKSSSCKTSQGKGQSTQFTLMMFDNGVSSGDVCHPIHQKTLSRDKIAKQTMQRLTASSTAPAIPRSTSRQPVKWSSSLLSRSWKTADTPKPPNYLLKCMPSDVGLEIVSETLMDAKNQQRDIVRNRRKLVSYNNSCPHQNSRKQGGATSVLQYRAKSVTLPLHDLLQEQAYNTTTMSNYGRKRFLIPSSSMNLIEKEVAIPPRPMSEFAEAQLKKLAALKENQKKMENAAKKSGAPAKAVSKGISMFDEIKGLMKKSHSQSKEADNRIIKIPDEN